MNCEKILDSVYEYYGEDPQGGPMPLLPQVRIGLHLLVCPGCAREIERFRQSRDILRSDFLPPSPGFEDSVMKLLAAEEEIEETAETTGLFEIPGGLSTRGWVIAGLVILLSLATAFFGLDFNRIALAAGSSFLLPVGLTIGVVLTSYGALFIGSHLKELSGRFGL